MVANKPRRCTQQKFGRPDEHRKRKKPKRPSGFCLEQNGNSPLCHLVCFTLPSLTSSYNQLKAVATSLITLKFALVTIRLKWNGIQGNRHSAEDHKEPLSDQHAGLMMVCRTFLVWSFHWIRGHLLPCVHLFSDNTRVTWRYFILTPNHPHDERKTSQNVAQLIERKGQILQQVIVLTGSRTWQNGGYHRSTNNQKRIARISPVGETVWTAFLLSVSS